MNPSIGGNIGSKANAGKGELAEPRSRSLPNVASEAGEPPIRYQGPRGSLAGLENDKSAYIQMNGSGYKKRPQNVMELQRPAPKQATAPPMRNAVFTNGHRVRGTIGLDRYLSKLL